MMRIARLYRSRLVHHVTTCIYSLWERGFWLYGLFLREFQAIFGDVGTLLFSFSYLRSSFLLTILLLSIDRKSTRLNSSHSQISYAVFCLKKKKTTITSILY